jgi:hypothetical protein
VTTLASWAKAIGTALEAGGIDSGKLFGEAGIDRSLFADRIPRADGTRLPAATRPNQRRTERAHFLQRVLAEPISCRSVKTS